MWQKHIMPQNQIIMSGCSNSTVYYFDSMCKSMLFYQYMAIEFYCYSMWQKHIIFSEWGNSTLFCQYAAKAYYFVSMSEKHIILSVCGKSIVYYFVSICKKYIILSVRGNSIVFCSCMWITTAACFDKMLLLVNNVCNSQIIYTKQVNRIVRVLVLAYSLCKQRAKVR
jgi:hypothetical protein